jgi:hypothetical protein
MSSIDLPPALRRQPVYLTLNLPQRGRQVLGADLNRSESRRYRHTIRQEAAALRDFNPVYVRFGSMLLKNLRFD